MKSKPTLLKIKMLVRDLSKNWPDKSASAIARKYRVKLRYIGSGIDRTAFLVVGTGIVLKLSERIGQSSRELKRISSIRRKTPSLSRYLPKVYRFGCSVSARNSSSVVAMEYCPKRATNKEVDEIGRLFKNLNDVHDNNIRKTKAGVVKIIDLGY